MSELLNLSDIAEINKCGRRHARDVIVKLPGHPKEAPTSTPRNRLWVRREILSYINRKPAQIPHTEPEPA